MPTDKRTRLSPGARRAQLIALGAEMLAERRLEEVGVEEIADRAGISRGLLFHYFASKQDFHLAVVREMAAAMLERTAPDPALPPLEALHSSLSAFIDFVSENRSGYVSLLRGAASGDEAMRQVFDDTRAEMASRTLAQTPVLGIPAGPRTRLAVRGWIAFTEEAVISWLAEDDLSREELIDLISQALTALLLGAAPQ
ncbi:TetR/AcrR family transcriptional regulator [Rhodococcus sp. X156]|uniref:TetR/AcrR family transcriptional regulator n=1 Tax=Rhodococcus sp. X156 TaxID=2499145 RepID=UPI000FDB35BF|nr:TetR/AcrR family transcriptional regulator [Rhodococcus sp. X156]